MYLRHFQLHAQPFSLAPTADLTVWTPGLQAIQTRVLAAINDSIPLIVLTGNVGAGKTTFLSALLRDGIPAHVHTVFLRGSISYADDLLRHVAEDLPAAPAADGSPSAQISALAKRSSVLVMLDEAQGAAPDAVIELCQLARHTGRLTILLCGQPELKTRLAGAEYRGLDVSPDHRHVIALPDEAEAQDYISGRIEKSGGTTDLIEPDARQVIVRAAGRVPRKINKIADACLFLAATEGRETIDAAFAAHVIADELDPVTFALSLSASDLMPPPDARVALPDDTVTEAEIPDRKELPEPVDDGLQPIAVERPPPRPEADPLTDPEPTRTQSTGRWIAMGAGMAAAVPVLVILFTLLPDPKRPDPENRAIAPIEAQQSLAGNDSPDMFSTPEDVVAWADPDMTAFEAGTPPKSPVADARVSELGSGPVATPSPDPAILAPAEAAETEIALLYSAALSEDDTRQSAIGYARAAILGHARAASYIGQKYETGDGVSFSPEMAERWYDVARGETPESAGPIEGPTFATPVQAVMQDGRIDLVWDGSAQVFIVELANDEGMVIGRAETTLPALSLQAVEDAASWRVRASGEVFSDWMPITPE